MALCCNDCYPICQPFNSCPDAVYIYAPIGYDSVLVDIIKPGVNVAIQQLLSVGIDGYVELDMEGLPEGFLNPYGGQYSITFIEPDTNQVIDFMALDGKIYDSICLTFQVAYTNLETNIISINAINNDTLEL
jgi:hypothetical protein